MTMVVLITQLLSLVNQQIVFDLADRRCQNDVMIASINGAEVFASCASDGGERIMRVWVRNLAGSEEGPLRDFSIEFCDLSVIEASGPPGWIGTIKGDEHHRVTWSLPDTLVDTLGLPSGVAADGFLVRLRREWALSRSVSARWGTTDSRNRFWTHDCPRTRSDTALDGTNFDLDPMLFVRKEAKRGDLR